MLLVDPNVLHVMYFTFYCFPFTKIRSNNFLLFIIALKWATIGKLEYNVFAVSQNYNAMLMRHRIDATVLD